MPERHTPRKIAEDADAFIRASQGSSSRLSSHQVSPDLNSQQIVKDAEAFVRSEPIIDGLNPRRFCEDTLDEDFQNVFYISDFLKTDVAGKRFKDVEEMGEFMYKFFPEWQSRRSKFLKQDGYKNGSRIVRELTLSRLARVAFLATDTYYQAINSDELEAEYIESYNQWSDFALAADYAAKKHLSNAGVIK